MNLFFIFSTIILITIHGVVGIRIIPFLNLSYPIKVITWSSIAILATLPIIPIVLRSKGFEDEVVDLFSWAGYISLGFFVLTFLAVITKDIIYIIIGLLSKAAATINHSPEPIDPDRRDFIEKC